MDNAKIIVEAVGYIGSALVLISMLMTSVVKLRLINTIGSLIFTGYALMIQSYPTAAMNFCLALINIYNLIKLFRNKKEYSVIKVRPDNALISHFFGLYEEDIKKFFPEADKNQALDRAYLVCYGTDAAGILLGKADHDGSIDVKIDYTTPVYRDCSAGKYLYTYLASQHIPAVFASTNSEIHRRYLLKMGFSENNGRFEKKLA